MELCCWAWRCMHPMAGWSSGCCLHMVHLNLSIESTCTFIVPKEILFYLEEHTRIFVQYGRKAICLPREGELHLRVLQYYIILEKSTKGWRIQGTTSSRETWCRLVTAVQQVQPPVGTKKYVSNPNGGNFAKNTRLKVSLWSVLFCICENTTLPLLSTTGMKLEKHEVKVAYLWHHW